jgi:prophage antirepressor-like protein
MNIITISSVRAYLDEKQTAMLNLEDVSKGLGFTQIKNGVEYVRWERVNQYLNELKFPTNGENGFIPENIFYRLAMKANNEVANKFQEKIANDVLPDIRKHGLYMNNDVLEKTLENPQFLIDILQKYQQEKARVKMLIHAKKLYTSTEIAKEIGFKSAKALNEDLRQRKIQYKVNKTWVLSSDYANKGFTSIKEQVLDNGKVIYDRKWTGTGREFLLNLYKEEV